jgi:anthranilate synthase
VKPMQSTQYRARGGLTVFRASTGVDGADAKQELMTALDSTPGLLLSSACDYPGRYSRWDLGFAAPPLQITARGRRVEFSALNARGQVLLQMLAPHFSEGADYTDFLRTPELLAFTVRAAEPVRFEEERTRQRSVFTVLRSLLDLFGSDEDGQLGLYGAFGYELAFQFEAVQQRLARDAAQRDLVLYLPDSILVVDHKREVAQQHVYDFAFEHAGRTLGTAGLPRAVQQTAFVPGTGPAEPQSDHAPGAYAAVVGKALDAFRRGDLFEVVPGQTFRRACSDAPSRVFQRLQQQNPAPYGALLNLGEAEYLVAASPEMYVRVEGRQVETCPISGTIARGRDALEDADQIRTLLNSEKEEAELSMCTDVDRNDNSRVCVPGSVQLRGRRLIELYSRLIHTVDHVVGELKPGFDALDAFLSHAWAVTVTGAPKQAAIQFLEDHEAGVRHWYGGAMGCLHFNGSLNSGLTLRTIRIKGGNAEVRVGATLLSDSIPEAEEAETRLKASALLQALQLPSPSAVRAAPRDAQQPAGQGLRILMVDHQDSFVHTLSSYLQETGAAVRTVRPALVAEVLQDFRPDLVVLSPGPGRPEDHCVGRTLALALAQGIPAFGVCLGLQGIVEYFGGSLGVLPQPVHGKQSRLQQQHGVLFAGLPQGLRVGRYHSLVADRMPAVLEVCARSEDGAVMAVQHRQLPVFAVQFHPESILSTGDDAGRMLLHNLLQVVRMRGRRVANA